MNVILHLCQAGLSNVDESIFIFGEFHSVCWSVVFSLLVDTPDFLSVVLFLHRALISLAHQLCLVELYIKSICPLVTSGTLLALETILLTSKHYSKSAIYSLIWCSHFIHTSYIFSRLFTGLVSSILHMKYVLLLPSFRSIP